MPAQLMPIMDVDDDMHRSRRELSPGQINRRSFQTYQVGCSSKSIQPVLPRSDRISKAIGDPRPGLHKNTFVSWALTSNETRLLFAQSIVSCS